MPAKCPNCGANLPGDAHGAVTCPYCGAEATIGPDPASIARRLRTDFAGVDALINHLAGALAKELPHLVKVEAGGGFFSSGPPVGVEITLGTDTLSLRKNGQTVVATRRKVVRGIALKNETLDLDAWVDALAAGLSTLAEKNAAAQAALSKLSR